MPHAILTISPLNRATIESSQLALVRTEFADLAKHCCRSPVILYQSGRGAAGVKTPSGYFATAVIGDVYNRRDDPAHCVVELSNLVPFDVPRRMVMNGTVWESSLLTAKGTFDGRMAARDFRLLSLQEFMNIVKYTEPPLMAPNSGLSEDAGTPLFADRHYRVRDPFFARWVYLAYEGRCSISGVTFMNENGDLCGLEAAHLYPYRLEQLNTVRSGLLLAPSWHRRYDMGNIVIHDDYSWSAVVEDSDTLAIADRHLELPASREDRPDVELIRRHRNLLNLDS